MLRLSSSRLLPGMIIGRPIINASGRVLLAGGQVLNERYIKRIQELDIPMVYIEDQLGVEDPPAPVGSVTVLNATKNLKNSYQQYTKTGKIDLRALHAEIDNIIDELISNQKILVGMSDLKTYDDYTYQHSVNVCILAIMLGISHGYNRPQVQALGTGAILHDIGKMSIPLEILNKPGSLSDVEYKIIQHHPWEGFKIIKNSSDLALLSAHVALQHHERCDGSGYPRGLNTDHIHEYGLIAAVADIFDALVSDRPYRRGYNNQEAMNIIEREKGTHLSPKFVDFLFSHINIYPPGTVVALTTGDIAVVSKDSVNDPKMPQVKLLFDAQQHLYDLDRLIDLTAYRTIAITRALPLAEADKYISLYLLQTQNTSLPVN